MDERKAQGNGQPEPGDVPPWMGWVANENKALRAELKSDSEALRQELKSDHESLRKELKSDHESLRKELKSDNESLRTELKSDNESLRTELKSDNESLRKELKGEIKASEGRQGKLLRAEIKASEGRMVMKTAVIVGVAFTLFGVFLSLGGPYIARQAPPAAPIPVEIILREPLRAYPLEGSADSEESLAAEPAGTPLDEGAEGARQAASG